MRTSLSPPEKNIACGLHQSRSCNNSLAAVWIDTFPGVRLQDSVSRYRYCPRSIARKRGICCSPRLFRIDLGDLVAMDAESDHQPLLAEDEGIDVVLRSRGRQRLRLALVHHDHRRADPDSSAPSPY